MEQIYIVKVRWKPGEDAGWRRGGGVDSGSQFPSERAYSASTVGGLAGLHLCLSLLGSLLLIAALPTSVELVLGSVLLLSGGLSAGVTGGLASRLWYIDRHIRWFLWAASYSTVSSALALLLMALAALGPLPPLLPPSTSQLTTPLRTDIFFHVFLSTFFEFLISLLSVRISLDGVRNTRELLKSSSSSSSPSSEASLNRAPQLIKPFHKAPSDAPSYYYADVVRELCKLHSRNSSSTVGHENLVSRLCSPQGSAPPPPGLSDHPLPPAETHREYTERMEKFLAYNSHEPPSITTKD